jgi:spore germination protein
MTGLNLMLGDMHGGTMEFKYKGDLITFQIFNAKAVTRIDDKNPHRLKFNIDLGIEGGIIEVFGNKNFNNLKYIEGVEKAAEKKAEEIISSLIEKAQTELHAEIFDFDNQLRERHYDTWQKIKDNWDHGEDYYAKSEIHVKAKVKVRSIGALNRTKNNNKE